MSDDESEGVTEVVPPAKRTLYAFDFDRTLVNTRDKSLWEEMTGTPWSDGNWFADTRSLSAHTKGPAMNAYFEALKDENAVILIHTGRSQVMKEPVIEALAGYGVTRFDEIGFCTKGRRALKQKVGRIMGLIAAHDIRRIVMYDDKAINVARFRSRHGCGRQKGRHRRSAPRRRHSQRCSRGRRGL